MDDEGTDKRNESAEIAVDEAVEFVVVIDGVADIVAARQQGRVLADRLGFPSIDLTLIATAISEVAWNIVEHAGRGEVRLRAVSQVGRIGICIVARDCGPGIADVERALLDGYSTHRGLGLHGARRLVDEFSIVSEIGSGTTVTMRKWIRAGRRRSRSEHVRQAVRRRGRPRGEVPREAAVSAMVRATVDELAREYQQALEDCVRGGGEGSLLRAYQLGRRAVPEGFGVLEWAAVHQEALAAVLLRRLAPAEHARVVREAAQFFAEALAPFEMNQRGVREASAVLQVLNAELDHRVAATIAKYEATREQLEEHQRLGHMKDDFISIVSHELRTPLTSIHGAIDLVRAIGGDLPPEARHLLEIAHRNCQRLARLVDEILDLGRIESHEMVFKIEELEIGSLLEQALEANQAYAERFGVRLVLDAPIPVARVAADPHRLMQVVTNLIANAVRFSPPAETVVVKARRVDGRARVSVEDHGPGIPEEFRSRVFQRFAQADTSNTRPREGTGLGLSISKAIIERLCGCIGFETQAALGTTFHFELPESPKDGGAFSGQEEGELRSEP